MIGYNPDFIGEGIHIPKPVLTPQISALATQTVDSHQTIYLDYVHYTVVMNKTTRQPIYTASNIDQDKFKKTQRSDNWKLDSRILTNDQLNNEYYKKNDWDKGHMVMRNNTAWGESLHEAQTADDESFYYTNAAFQHKNLNRDEWLGLEEDIVRIFSDDANNKLCIFTGPIYGDLDRHYTRSWHDTVRIPSGFFKVICYKAKDTAIQKPLGVKAFAIFQDEEIIKDQKGRKSIKYKEYQVTVGELQDLTGLDFGQEIFNANPLFYYDTEERRENLNVSMFPERIPIDHGENIVDHNEYRISSGYIDNKDVVIISAMINPEGKDSENEWIALHNRTSKKIDLDGWVIADQQNRYAELSGNITSGATLKLQGEKMGKLILTNSGGSLRVVNTQFRVIDIVRWSDLDVNRTGKGRAVIFGQDA